MQKTLNIIKEAVSWLIFIAIFCLFIFTSYHTFTGAKTGEGFFLFGYRPVLVLSGSMEPYMMTNGIVLTKEVESLEDINVDDVITFHVNHNNKAIRITHRIIDIDGETIYTKGDNNNVDDGIPLSIDHVEAKVTHVFNQTAWLVAKWQSGLSGKVMLLSFAFSIVMFYFLIKLCINSFMNKEREDTVHEVIGEIVAFEQNPSIPHKSISESIPNETSKKNTAK